MRKFFLITTLFCLAVCSNAETVEINGLNYDLILKGKVANVVKYSSIKYNGDIIIPSTISYNGVDYSVISIDSYAFSGCSDLKSIVIPNSVTSIGKDVFYGCSGLKSVYIDDITSWCNTNFSDSDSNPLHYAKNLYVSNDLVKDLVIPHSVTSIGSYAFSNCSCLTSVFIPNSVTSIGSYVFSNCTNLKSVYIDDIVSWCNIGFSDPQSNPLYYANNLYIKNELLKDLVIPSSVNSIRDNAFLNCSSLSSVMISTSVTSIGSNAFYGCSSLTFVEIPSSVTSIGYYAFSGCTELTSMIIPNSVTWIGNNAFKGCTGLTSITIPNSVTSIGSSAFSGCSGLTSVYLPNSINNIREYAFEGCSSLTSIVIPESLTQIYFETFKNCTSLTSIVIPESVSSIGGGAFQNCNNLETVYCQGIIPPSVLKLPFAEADIFKDSYINYSTLYVPAEAIDAYKVADQWKDFGKILSIEGVDVPGVPVTPQCESPMITYENGKFIATSATEGATCKLHITMEALDADDKTEATAKFVVTAYATAEGYQNSGTTTVEFTILPGDITGDGVLSVSDLTTIAKKILEGDNYGSLEIRKEVVPH